MSEYKFNFNEGLDPALWGRTNVFPLPPLPPPPKAPDNGGLRFNDSKDRWDLLPWDALEVLVKIYTKGAVKYAPRNWERGMSWSKMVSSMMRHFVRRVVYREVIDPETGEPHFGHMAWNAIGLLTYDLRSIGEDDITMERHDEI